MFLVADDIQVFMSFSVPAPTWQELSQEGVTFILRGIPDNDFEVLAQKLIDLDISADVNIDPTAFERYKVDAVPAIVYKDKKVTGNIRIDEALKILEGK